ncbi:Uncharacterized protein AC499_0521 [Pseudomonas amygdali pv. lachrymans]|nr:Uncharacterized protein AC499_0521 [Pseudomonas amygdali pv. lachrymans]
MDRLLKALESDMAHPDRAAYRYDEGQEIQFFEFYTYR